MTDPGPVHGRGDKCDKQQTQLDFSDLDSVLKSAFKKLLQVWACVHKRHGFKLAVCGTTGLLCAGPG